MHPSRMFLPASRPVQVLVGWDIQFRVVGEIVCPICGLILGLLVEEVAIPIYETRWA